MTSREDSQSRGALLRKKIYDPLHGSVTGKGKHFDGNHKKNPPTEDLEGVLSRVTFNSI